MGCKLLPTKATSHNAMEDFTNACLEYITQPVWKPLMPHIIDTSFVIGVLQLLQVNRLYMKHREYTNKLN